MKSHAPKLRRSVLLGTFSLLFALTLQAQAPGPQGRGGGGRGGAAPAAPTNAPATAAQSAAVSLMDSTTATLSQAATAAESALTAASFQLPVNSQDISAKANAVGDAQLALALARANAIMALQNSANRLNDTQLTALRNRAAAATGGRGGFGRGSGLPLDVNDHDGYVQIFDGKTLDGWDGAPGIWTVEDGAITARNGQPVGTTYIIWTGGKVRDFELKLDYKIQGGNTGLQYRSRRTGGMEEGHGGHAPDITPEAARGNPGAQPTPPFGRGNAAEALPFAKWDLGGYQFDLGGTNTGQLYEQDGRGITIRAGQVGELVPGLTGPLWVVTGELGDTSQVDKPGEWNTIHLIAIGNSLTHIVNGKLMSQTYDNDPDYFAAEGNLGLQIEGSGLVQFRNIWLKRY